MASTTVLTSADKAGRARRWRLFWMQQLRAWHWMSSALCLVALIGFAVTGFTLNHAGQIQAEPKVETRQAQAPAPVKAAVGAGPQAGKAPLPAPARAWIRQTLAVEVGDRPAEWSASEAYVDLPRPGGEAWLTIDRQSGQVEYENTTRGLLAVLNDLHKGRNAGPAWGWFIDLFAGACLVFALTGLVLLHLHAANRAATWPLVGAGFLLPLAVVVLIFHT